MPVRLPVQAGASSRQSTTPGGRRRLRVDSPSFALVSLEILWQPRSSSLPDSVRQAHRADAGAVCRWSVAGVADVDELGGPGVVDGGLALADSRVATKPPDPARRLPSGLPAGLPAVSEEMGRFVTVSDVFSPRNTQ